MKPLLLLFLTTLTVFAQDAFINSAQLKERLKHKNLVLIDTTDIKTYQKEHIKDARRVDIGSFRYWVDNTYLLMKSSKEIQEVAVSLGINSDSEVIIYGHNKDKELLKSSYIALALIVNGFSNISILNGGYQDYSYGDESNCLIKKEKIAPSPKVKKGNFVAKFNPNILVDLDYVLAHIGKVPMIEARPKAYYTGEKKSKGVRRRGHITGATSSFWRDKFSTDDILKPDEVLKSIFIDAQKLNPNKEVITYCTGGLEASMNWYILTQHLGFKDVKLYDASMKQWGNLDTTPMQK